MGQVVVCEEPDLQTSGRCNLTFEASYGGMFGEHSCECFEERKDCLGSLALKAVGDFW